MQEPFDVGDAFIEQFFAESTLGLRLQDDFGGLRCGVGSSVAHLRRGLSFGGGDLLFRLLGPAPDEFGGALMRLARDNLGLGLRLSDNRLGFGLGLGLLADEGGEQRLGLAAQIGSFGKIA